MHSLPLTTTESAVCERKREKQIKLEWDG